MAAQADNGAGSTVHRRRPSSESRTMLVSGTNHGRDLDLDWQSMSVH